MTKQLERDVTIHLDGSRVLEGVYLAAGNAADVGAVVAPPHPLMGGSMDHPVVNELCYACHKGAAAALRFNWRGVGASAGEPSGDVADGDADYSAALQFVEESVDGPIIAAGYSYGAGLAVRAAGRHPRVRRLLLVAPPVALLDAGELEAFGGSILVIAARHDGFAPVAELEEVLADTRRSMLHVVDDADHFFQQGLAEIPRVVDRWL